jgi:hypothetical protein
MLANKGPEALKDLGEIAVVGYAVSKSKDGDPIRSQGRIGGSTYVRNDAQYAGVAGGHMIAGHYFALIWVHFFAFMCVVWAVALYLGCNLLHASGAGPWMLGIALGYVLIWRIGIKLPWKGLFKHAPNITFADGYRGPLGTGHTVYSNAADAPAVVKTYRKDGTVKTYVHYR